MYSERLAARGELPPGTLVGEYILEELIARCGCGAVHSARHSGSGRRAAVKVPNEAVAHATRVLERFAREIEVLHRISHPNTVEIYEVDTLDDHRPFDAMERLEGQTLDAFIEARDPARAPRCARADGTCMRRARGLRTPARDGPPRARGAEPERLARPSHRNERAPDARHGRQADAPWPPCAPHGAP
ncbi:uncharacterized protein SOCEGT47_049980 [Sorangium cellulosum]|uniref:Protein kinase domain-containing protein n=1 Tax=Sorangium cellulosum TaxID=56 RepID=A0A4P2Q506_SORCE|nr:hypothetical protein [Sorangium cellulosum]AUX24460.1 uncharacterized protein SOCEGT47_049980 [Sorangium cellulosum]